MLVCIDPLQFYVGWVSGRVDCCNKILKEAPPSKNTCNAEVPGKSSHRLELLRNYNNLYLMKVNWPVRISEDPSKLLFDSILHALNTQRMTDTGMEKAYV